MSDNLEKLALSSSSLNEIEKACIHHMHLGPGVCTQRLASWSHFDWVDGILSSGVGAYLFFISPDMVGYVAWHFERDGRLSFPSVQVSGSFDELQLPSGVVWERVAEEMNEADLATRAVA